MKLFQYSEVVIALLARFLAKFQRMLSAISVAEQASMWGHKFSSHKKVERQTSHDANLVANGVSSDGEHN